MTDLQQFTAFPAGFVHFARMHALEDPGMGRPSMVNAEIDFEIRKIYRILLRNTRFFAVSRKITERKTAENAIQHTRAKFGNSDFPESQK